MIHDIHDIPVVSRHVPFVRSQSDPHGTNASATAHEEPMQLIACGHGEPRMVGGSLEWTEWTSSSGENFIAGDVFLKKHDNVLKN